MKDLFHFSLFERKGVISLLCMALILFLLPRWWSRHGYTNQEIKVRILTVQPSAAMAAPPAIMEVEQEQELVVAGTKSRSTPSYLLINQADEAEWARLRGIGKVLSRRIVVFRDKMGGFVDIDQVGQTYGLADSVFQKIRPQLRLEKEHRRWPVNTLSADELARHPYISPRQARAVVAYRKQIGFFPSAEAFRQLRVFTAEEHQRLAPYLDFVLPDPQGQSPSTEKEK